SRSWYGINRYSFRMVCRDESFKSRSITFSLKFGEKVFNSKSFGYASELFGRYHPKYLPNGTKGKLNTGIIRIGWGNNNGVHTFRTSIFHSPNQIHID